MVSPDFSTDFRYAPAALPPFTLSVAATAVFCVNASRSLSARTTLTPFAAAACMALGACNTVHKNIGTEDPYFGEAAKYNAALQTINPDPVYAEGGAQPGDNGEKGAAAVKRYRKDEVNARHKAEANASRSGALGTTQGTGGGPH